MPLLESKIGYNPRGAHNPATADYKAMDIVTSVTSGSTTAYECIATWPNAVPANTPITNTTYWRVFAQGVNGANGTNGTNGTNGVGYDGVTSSTSLAIGTGSKTFAINKQGAYAIGARVRMANSATAWMEGDISAISASSVTIAVDLVGGTGTLASWSMSLAGERGVAGITPTFAYSAGVLSITT